jgi:hypothetical protein
VGIQGPNINNTTMKIVARTCFFNNVPYVVLRSQLASTKITTRQSACHDNHCHRTIVDPFACQSAATEQSTREAVAAKTAIVVEKPASKDGVGSTEDCVSQYSPDSGTGPLSTASAAQDCQHANNNNSNDNNGSDSGT